MSSALTQLVHVFKGIDWTFWEPVAEAYINAQGQGSILTTSRRPDGDDNQANWDELNQKAMGNIQLCVTPSITENIRSKTTAKEMWETLKAEYGKPGLLVIYPHFKAALAVTMQNNSHPAPAINEMISRFHKLTAQNITISEFVQAMLLLTKLPQSMDYIVQSFYQKENIYNVKFDDVRRAIIVHWEKHEAQRPPLVMRTNCPRSSARDLTQSFGPSSSTPMEEAARATGVDSKPLAPIVVDETSINLARTRTHTSPPR